MCLSVCLSVCLWFLPRDALQCKARSCDRMSSVLLSVTLVDHDHIGWKSWKLIPRTISPTSLLFVAQRSSTYSQGNMDRLWEENVRSTPTSITSGWIDSTESHVILSGGVAVCLLLLAHRAVISAIAQLSFSVSPCITRKPHSRTSPNFLCMHVACGWGPGSVLLGRRCDTLYVLPVLRMTSCHGTSEQSQARRCVVTVVGRARAVAAHWLGGQACWCLMLAVRCTRGRGRSPLSMIVLLCARLA